MATPEPWENTTPVYGIRYPKPTAPAQYLPSMFEHTGLDVEAALQTASIPPVTPAPVMVAATAAARDAYWTVPANETERLALQARGATTIRTDVGWTERYFATYGPANTAGAVPAGWYPVTGGPAIRVIRGAGGWNMPNADRDILVGTFWAAPNGDSGGVRGTMGNPEADGKITPALPGIYRVDLGLGKSGAGTLRIRVGHSRLGTVAITSSPEAGGVFAAIGTDVPFRAGDYIFGSTYATVAGDSNVNDRSQFFSARYLAPIRGA